MNGVETLAGGAVRANLVASALPHRTLSAAVFVAVVLVGLLLAVRFRSRVAHEVRVFFSEPGSAFNLAVLRLVFYGTALALVDIPLHTAEHYAALPRGLMVPPAGFSLIAAHFPISVTLVQIAFWISVAASVLAAIGLFTRVAGVAFLVAATYYLTVPEIFGKVNHYHAVIWVAAVLAVSRTADALSLDSVIRAFRGGKNPVSRSTAYSRPIRMTWLFLGLSYLGPGLWKYRTAGLDWAQPSNMRAIMYNKWFELGGYRPFVPVDRSGLLLTLGALATLGFELSFFFLIWNRHTRILAAVMGLSFHSMTNLTLRIGFYWAMMLYVSFVDWEWLAGRVLRRRETLIFAFDGGCGLCRKTVAALASNTIPGGVTYTSAQELDAAGGVPPGMMLSQLLTDIRLIGRDRTYSGFDAYRRLAWRVPLSWPALPLLYLPPVVEVGKRVYRRVADHRLCHIPQGELKVQLERPRLHPRAWTLAPSIIGAIVIAAMLTAIADDRTSAWPVALYPTFAGLHQPTFNVLNVTVHTPGSDVAKLVPLQSCFRWMPTDRYAGLVRATVYRAAQGQHELIRELVVAAGKNCPALRGGGQTLSFFNQQVDTTPRIVGQTVARTLLLRWST